jgi:hypothetical protein
VDPRVAVIRLGAQLSEEVRAKSGVPQRSVFGPLLFLAYVNDIWEIIESNIRIFADDCIIYRKILNNNDLEILQIDLNGLGECAFENEMIINPAKSRAVCFTKARVTESLNYSLGDIVIPKGKSCKYLGIILRSDLSWADQVNYAVKKPGSHFTLQYVFLIKRNSNT